MYWFLNYIDTFEYKYMYGAMLSSFNASDSVSVVVDVVDAGFSVSALLRGFFLRKSSGVLSVSHEASLS